MLKGYVFDKQLFESKIFAYFMDTFLNKKVELENMAITWKLHIVAQI